MSESHIGGGSELHVASGDNQSAMHSQGTPSYDSDSDDASDCSTCSVRSSPHEVPKLEADFYYFGIRGSTRLGPKLIFRTSKDVFTLPEPGQAARIMQLRPVYEHDKLDKDDLWATIRSKIVQLLDQRSIKHSSIDIARFSWVEAGENVDEEDEKDSEDSEDSGDSENSEDDEDTGSEENEDIDNKIPPYDKVVTTPVTIWIGVLPDTLSGEAAFHSSNDILDLLKHHDVSDVDVAYRESVVMDLGGPKLFAPVPNFHPLETVIDPVTTALSLPIAGLKTLHNEGTMGFYFRVGRALYGVTARHVLFPANEGNDSYTYIAGRKKEVVLMGDRVFTNFLTSTQHRIEVLNLVVPSLESEPKATTRQLEGSGSKAEQVAHELAKTEASDMRVEIKEVEKFVMNMKERWTKPNDRVIGRIVWAPSIGSVPTPPEPGYTQDVCVVKLDKNKFGEDFKGNVLDLGPERDAVNFTTLMYSRIGGPFHFRYPHDRLLALRGILSPQEMRTPSNHDRNGDPTRYVIKRGPTTLTTIGRLNGFESHVRRYDTSGSRDSVEAAVYPYDNRSGTFAEEGDSGSMIVDACGNYVALLTSGTGTAEFTDITFGTPMHWLWGVIQAQFPGATLHCKGVDLRSTSHTNT